MTEKIEKGKAGTSFKDFLKEQGTYEQATERAEKRVCDFSIYQKAKNQRRHI